MPLFPSPTCAPVRNRSATRWRFRRAAGIGAIVAIGLAWTGCRAAPSADAPRSPAASGDASGSSGAAAAAVTRVDLPAGPVRSLVARRLVAGPVGDRLETPGRVLLARGAALDVIEADGSWSRLTPGGRIPVADLALHEGVVHLVLRDGQVLRAAGAWPAPRFVVLPEPDDGADPAGPEATAPRLASLGGDLYRLHADRLTRWRRETASEGAGDGADDDALVAELLVIDASPLRGSVVPGADGPLVTAGRRAFRADTGDYAGSASRLQSAPAGSAWPGRLLYARNAPAGRPGPSEIGAMDGRLREQDRTRLRLSFAAPVVALAFDRGRAVVATTEAVHLLKVGAGPLRIAASRPLAPGERLWSDGPDAAAILRPDGSLAALPGDPPRDDAVVRATVAITRAGGASLPAPRAAAFDGRTLRVRTASGVQDLGLSGAVRPAAGVAPASVADSARMRRSVVTRRGRLQLDPAGRLERGDGTLGPLGGLAAVDGFAWAGGDGRLLLLDPRDGSLLAAIDVDGRPRWAGPVPGGRGSMILTDAGEAWRIDLVRRPGG